MCGIAGVYRRGERTDDTAAVRRMMTRLVHRGPDGEGLDGDGRVTLGHRRLKILDLTEAARQPMRSACGRYLIVFNGEIYNYRDLREWLDLPEGTLRSTGDTEVLLEAWARCGTQILPRLVGQFALAVHDREEDRLWLARDRFGEKPLFYHESEEAVTFASTLGSLVQAPWVPRNLDPDALAEYVTMRYVVSPRTVLSGVRKLAPGHLLSIGSDGVATRAWYAPRFAHSPNGMGDPGAQVEMFDTLFTRATRRCLVSDVPVALLLSGGIDSQSIRAALLRDGDPIPSYTYRLSASGSEIEEAATPGARDLVVTADARVREMRSAFGSLNEPIGDGASLATWLLIRSARADATVFLCGHGSDELVGGYRLSQDRFRLAAMRHLAWLPEAWVGKTLNRFLYGDEPLDVRRRAFRALPADRAPEAARYIIHRPLPVDDLRELFGSADPPGRYLSAVQALYAGCSEAARDLDRMQEVMLRTFLSENILSFADAVAMDSSAELRMPFLDRDLVQFVLGLPPASRVSRWPGRANTKLILRWWGERHLDPEIVRRRKRTFNFGSLRPLLATHGDRLRSYVLDSPAVRHALPGVERWLSHPPVYYRGTWQGTLWALLSLGIWCQEYEIT